MDERGLFTAALIDSAARAYAAGAALRHSGSREPGDVPTGDLVDFATCQADCEEQLVHLAEAVACGRPALFRLHVEWMRDALAAHGVGTDVLRARLAHLTDELRQELPADAFACAKVALDGAAEALGQEPSSPPSLLEDESAPHCEHARRLVLALLEGRRDAAIREVLGACDGGLSVDDAYVHVLGRAQQEIGRMWQVGEASVAEEHAASRIIEEILVLLRQRMPEPADEAPTVLVACVAGESHQIGARIVADRLALEGMRVVFLGASTPADDLVRAAADYGADLVGLSVSSGRHVRAIAELVSSIRAAHPDLPVLVGGAPFAAIPDLWQAVGADAGAGDLSEAVRLAKELVRRRE